MKNTINLTSLGLDPGYKNYGWSVSKMAFPFGLSNDQSQSVKIKLMAFGKLQNTLDDFKKDVSKQVLSYHQELAEIIDKHGVTLVTVERYQSRGFKGIGVEYINVMLGILLQTLLIKQIKVNLILPSTWKNAVSRQGIVLTDLYSDYKNLLSPHEIDATFIAWYGAMVDSIPDVLPMSGLSSSVKQLINSSDGYKQKFGHCLII